MYRRKRPKSNNGVSKMRPRSYKAEETVFSNGDLVEEILARVPAMSLMRLKCVSKQWLTLISNPQFVSHHTRTHTKPSISGLYLFKQYQPFKDVSLSCHTSTPSLSYFQNEKGVESLVRVADSCNGLLLCCYNYIRKHYLVCNPTTRKYTLLPTPGPITAYYRCEVLVFDPLKSPHYKVVLVSWCGDLCQFDIYSSITSSWKQLQAPTPKNNIVFPCVYWEGEVHWVMNSAGKNFHCRFKVDTEELEVIELDSELRIHNGDKIRYFGRCGGSFLRIQVYSPKAMEFKILEMSSGQRRWRVKHTVSLKYDFPRGVYGSVEGLFSVVDILHGEKEDDLELVLAVRGKLVSYKIKSKTLKKITDLPVPEDGSYDPAHERMIEGFQFIESLAEVR